MQLAKHSMKVTLNFIVKPPIKTIKDVGRIFSQTTTENCFSGLFGIQSLEYRRIFRSLVLLFRSIKKIFPQKAFIYDRVRATTVICWPGSAFKVQPQNIQSTSWLQHAFFQSCKHSHNASGTIFQLKSVRIEAGDICEFNSCFITQPVYLLCFVISRGEPPL